MYDVAKNVAKAQMPFSELLGLVVFGRRRMFTTKRGKQRALLFTHGN